MRHLIRLLLFCFLLLTISTPLYAADGPLFRNATLRGTVTDEAGNPIAGVSVALYSDEYVQNMYSLEYGGVRTNANGEFEMTDQPEGVYRMALIDHQDRYATTFHPHTLVPLAANPIVLRNNNITTVDASMKLGGSISGRISLEGPNTFERVSISVHRHIEGAGWTLMKSISYHDPSTEFSIGGLPPGPYRISAGGQIDGIQDYAFIREWYGGEPTVEGGWDVHVAGTETTYIDWEIADPSVTLSGRVTSAEMGPLSDVGVSIYQFDPDREPGYEWLYAADYTSTDENGYYSVTLEEPGLYKVGFDDWRNRHTSIFNGGAPTLGGAPIIEVTDQDIAGIDIEMNKGGQLGGQILANGSADNIDYFYFDLYRWNDHDAYIQDYFHEQRLQPDGRFELTSVQAGQYRMRVRGTFKSGFVFESWIGGDSIDTATPFFVKTGETTDIGQFSPTGYDSVLEGTLTRSDTGAPVPNADVRIQLPFGSDYQKSASVRSDANGYYRFENLQEGTYGIRIYDSSDLLVDSGTDYNLVTPIDVSDDDVNVADIELDFGAQIKGQISTAEALGSTYVYLHQLHSDGVWRTVTSRYLENQTYFSFTGLNDGTYTLRFVAYTGWDAEPMVATEFLGDATSVEDAEHITVERGEIVSNADAYIDNYVPTQPYSSGLAVGSVSGRVTNDSAEPVAGVEVMVYAEYVGRRGGNYYVEVDSIGVTDANGYYTVNNIRIGEFRSTGSFKIGFNGSSVGHDTLYYGDTTLFDLAAEIALSASQPTVTGVDAVLTETGCTVNTCVPQ